MEEAGDRAGYIDQGDEVVVGLRNAGRGLRRRGLQTNENANIMAD
jgi:hypothetical protein